MSTFTTLRSIPNWFLSRSQRGWVGVDVGGACLKLAQMERVNGRLQFSARWVLEMEDVAGNESSESLAAALANCVPRIKQARQAFYGSLCATTVSLSASDMRSFDLPAGNEEELDAMVREELQGESESALDELCFDSWVAERNAAPGSGTTQVSVITIPRKVAEQLTKDLFRARLDCVALDGVPCALARAITLLPGPNPGPTVALDLGATSVTLVLASDGRPLFARQLRGCGLSAFLAPLCERLSITFAEARHLLSRLGVAPTNSADSGSSALNATHQLLAEPLAQLQTELRRTLGYMDQRFRAYAPKQMVLFGGGSLIPNLPACLASATGLPSRLWQLADGADGGSDPLFGVAAALSALAWEKPTCI